MSVAGGGVFSRAEKSIKLTREVKDVLGIDAGVEALSPTDLISAILRAPVDLLFNGGIGTYVKSSHESNADVGDRANNALRVDGRLALRQSEHGIAPFSVLGGLLAVADEILVDAELSWR